MNIGFKIEIVLISIAVFLCGCILLTLHLKPSEPEQVVLYVKETTTTNNQTFVEKETETLETEVLETENFNSQKININSASKENLMQLDGIGDVLSDRIISYRKEHKFIVESDIMNVSGIGEKTFEKIKDMITVK